VPAGQPTYEADEEGCAEDYLPRQDHVRYYVIYAACRARIEVVGGKEILKDEVMVVV
jgi:hypothetical protein